MEKIIKKVTSTQERVQKIIEEVSENTPEEQECLLDCIQENWERYQVAFTALEDNYEVSEELEDDYIILSKKYWKIVNLIKKSISQNKENSNQISEQTIKENIQVKLPVIKLQNFDGDYTKWTMFKNCFEVSIHNNVHINEFQKMQYLVGVLSGEALKAIDGLSIDEHNYQEAWNILIQTYENKKLLIEKHLENLCNFPIQKKENKSESIRNLVFHIKSNLGALKALQQPVEYWDILIIHLAKKNLDFIELRDWQYTVQATEEMPTLESFLKFLIERHHTLDILKENSKFGNIHTRSPRLCQQTALPTEKVISMVTTNTCKICNENHTVNKCQKFLELKCQDRRNEVFKLGLCFNCLNIGHISRVCKGSSCKLCNKRHNTLLHDETLNYCRENAMLNSCSRETKLNHVILSTAEVLITNAEGKKLKCRALLDPGSQTNFIKKDVVAFLNLPYNRQSNVISGISQTQIKIEKMVKIQINSLYTKFKANIECLELKTITGYSPISNISLTANTLSKYKPLADKNYNQSGEIQLLIGAGLYWQILLGAPQRQKEGPCIQNTQFGWILGGEIKEEIKETMTVSTNSCITNKDLNDQLEKFWLQETVSEKRRLTKEEKRCEEYFQKTLRRIENGRFVVSLPIRHEVKLGESKEQALSRMLILEKKLERNPELKETYHEFMEEYITSNHMTLVKSLSNVKGKEFYFIPHHAVLRPDSETTKLRVVFDASAKTTLNTSLNDKLMAGPNLQNDLFTIILRFRTYKFVITADIKKMFRQILVNSEDRDLQLIWWKRKKERQPQIFKLNTVTYGTVCAPYVAMRCLRELASLYKNKFPRAAKAVEEDFYMDDVLTGGNSLQDVMILQQQLSELLLYGQFQLRKWRSNNKQILSALHHQNTSTNFLVMDKEVAIKTLGLRWNSNEDTLQYNSNLNSNYEKITKRKVLSLISQIFDPLGLIAPILVTGKLFMQILWNKELEWDESLPNELQEKWKEYYLSLDLLNTIKISRNANPENISTNFDIFGFGDASENAFGACVYIVFKNERGEYQSHLLCAKTRVAPLKKISLPKLELEAAKLLANLIKTIDVALHNKINSIKLWSDSTIVLGWLKTDVCKLKTFVANRVTEIKEKTEGAIWNHVPSEENPADLASRGATVQNLTCSQLWWNGPEWMRTLRQYPANMKEPETELPETKSSAVTLLTTDTSILFYKYSSYSKLLRIISYCYRFRLMLTKFKKIGPLKAEEIIDSETKFLRWLQKENFGLELKTLVSKGELPRKSKLRALCPILDNEGLIRVGGRLQKANLTQEEKHPIVLPSRHYITTIILREIHQRLHHCPPEQLLHEARKRFWPISGQN